MQQVLSKQLQVWSVTGVDEYWQGVDEYWQERMMAQTLALQRCDITVSDWTIFQRVTCYPGLCL